MTSAPLTDTVGNQNEQGFVLPVVLGAIAILAIVSGLSVFLVQSTQRAISQLQTVSELRWALDAAEIDLKTALSTAGVAADGLILNVNPVAFDIDASIPAGANQIPQQFWSAKQGQRRTEYQGIRVIITYQDNRGLPSLNGGEPELLDPASQGVLSALGGGDGAFARLRDFTDIDNVRTFRGAERSEYRLRQRPPPTNSPIRSFRELGNILGFEEFSSQIGARFEDCVTVEPGVSVDPRFLCPQLRDRGDDVAAKQDDELSLNTVSASMRFTLLAIHPTQPRAMKRVIIVRKAGVVPFVRRLSSERLLNLQETNPVNYDEITPLFST